jgi:hypothetical protein
MAPGPVVIVVVDVYVDVQVHGEVNARFASLA